MSIKPNKLLASDMDGTLIPLDNDPVHKKSIRDFTDATEQAANLTLAYVTGRHLELALQGIKDHALPVPSFLSGDVGTTVYERAGNRWLPSRDYQKRMQAQLGGGRGEDIDQQLRPFDELKLQESERQSEFKRSFYTPSHFSEDEIQSIRKHLNSEGLQVSLILSKDAFANRGLLDILPHGVAKDTAVRFIQQRCQAEAQDTVFSGDSGNDLTVFQQGVQSTLVGNAAKNVRACVAGLIQKNPEHSATIYQAEGFYAAGVLEGARHFGVIEAQ